MFKNLAKLDIFEGQFEVHADDDTAEVPFAGLLDNKPKNYDYIYAAMVRAL